MMSLNPLLMIPARMASTRLPGKPLAEIGGLPMIVHVLRRAQAAELGPVIVATDSRKIAEIVTQHKAEAVLTSADHVSGSDRIFEAASLYDHARKHDVIINVQGDLPTVNPQDIATALHPLHDPDVDMATLVTPITNPEELHNPNVVKMVGTRIGQNRFRALYFTRAPAPFGEGPHYHHIGLYTYRRTALEKFVSLPPSPLERLERLEQLRALEAGMRLDAMEVSASPLGVDTPEDLEKIRKMIGAQA